MADKKKMKCTKCDWTGLETELKDGKCPKCGEAVEEVKEVAQVTEPAHTQATTETPKDEFEMAKVELEKAIADLGKELTEEEVQALIDEAKKDKKDEEHYYYYKDKDGSYKKIEPYYPYYYYKDGDKYYPYYPYYYYYDKKVHKALEALLDVVAKLSEKLSKVQSAEETVDSLLSELFKEPADPQQ